MSFKRFIYLGNGLAKRPGWFSWRHQTRDACDAAREAYLADRGPAARRRRADERLAKTPEARLLEDIFAASP